MNDILFRPANEVADLLRRGEVSARDLTTTLLSRIDGVNPALNAAVELRREEALQAAAAADGAIARRELLGPLHGVPMTIKDSFNVAGLHTTWGNPAFADFVSGSDATVVRRLQRAGAIIIGKTNVSFMLSDFGQTANDLYGVTNNPWDTTRTPGGSSGGSAAAVSAGLTFLEYGSDVVGSIRIPAGFCGVYGLRPSVGTVPLTGFQPPGPARPSEMTYMSAVGPIARSAGDLRTALRVTGGPEGQATRGYAWALSPPRHSRLADFRIGVVLDDGHAPVSSQIGTGLSDAVDALVRVGVTVVEGWPDGIDPARQYESFGFHVRLFFAMHEPGDEVVDLRELADHDARRMASRAAWNRYFDDVDVFLCPVNVTAAFPHDPRPHDQRTIATPDGERPYADQAFWVSHAAVPGVPAVVAPVGRAPAGLPIGAQILGPLYEDDTAITFAELLGQVVGGYERPPV